MESELYYLTEDFRNLKVCYDNLRISYEENLEKLKTCENDKNYFKSKMFKFKSYLSETKDKLKDYKDTNIRISEEKSALEDKIRFKLLFKNTNGISVGTSKDNQNNMRVSTNATSANKKGGSKYYKINKEKSVNTIGISSNRGPDVNEIENDLTKENAKKDLQIKMLNKTVDEYVYL